VNASVCQFGPEQNLVGILTEPSAGKVGPNDPAVLMLNVGLLHRVGPHRMSVELAKQLAAAGIRSLRFDMGGYGDSEVSIAAKSDVTRIYSDIRDAIDFLEREHNVHSFVLFGSCSGADNAHAVALRDPRVAGAILLDGHGYWTWRSYINHYLPRAFHVRVWINFARRGFSVQKELHEEERSPLRGQLRRPFGPRLEVRREIQSLANRGVQMLYVYTGGVEHYYNYAGQFFAMFRGLDARGKIEVEYFPDSDHTYTFAQDRERMFRRVIEWYGSRTWNPK